MTHRPLILITNDDGIASKGLRCAAEACDLLGEVLICAPTVQQSGTGRSMPPTSEGRIFGRDLVINGRPITGYAVEGTPAQVVQHGLFEIADRPVDLVVSGINYGENLGEGVTVSGRIVYNTHGVRGILAERKFYALLDSVPDIRTLIVLPICGHVEQTA